MGQTAWAAIGLLALFVIGMIPVFFIELRSVGNRIDGLGAGLGARIDRLDEQMERGFERIERRFESVDRRFDSVDQRFDRLETKIDATNAKLDDHVKGPTG